MKFNIKWLLYLPILFFFLPTFVFWVPFMGAGYLYFFIVLYIAISALFITDYKYCINKLISVYRYTPFKYIVWFLGLVILNSLILGLLGFANILNCIRSIVMQIILFVVPIMVYFLCIIGKYISLKNFMKLFIFLFWIMLILGFIAYIGQYFNIDFINNIFDFFANARIIKVEKLGKDILASNYEAFGLPRLDNLFEEPSFYARFLFLFLPMVYTFGLTRVKIYKNKIINLFVKKTLIPFTWANILLTLSPMFLILSLLNTAIYFFGDLVKLVRKYCIIIAIISIAILTATFIIFARVDLSETYLSRIINVLTEIHSFEDFIFVEPSLATRICTYINSFILFLKHPITGVGFGNIQNAISTQLLYSPIAITPEIAKKLNFAVISNTQYSYNSNFIFDLLATNGIFLFCIFIYFYKKLYDQIRNILNNYKSIYLFNYPIYKTFYFILISLFIKSCYDSAFADLDMYFIFSISILIIFMRRGVE